MRPLELRSKIQAQKKYKYLPETVIERAIDWAILREKKPKSIEKLARKKLHQIYGAYLAEFQAKTFQEALVKRDTDALLKQHSSTAERFALLPVFYQQIFNETGSVDSILDLACGLNPLTFPYFEMHCSSYSGLDLDGRLAEVLSGYFDSEKWNIGVADLLAKVTWPESDMIWLFKTLPCLEQQSKGSALTLLQSLSSLWLVISYPTQTLGGKNKGMLSSYTQQMENLVLDIPYQIQTTINFPNEVVFLLKKSPSVGL